ncbi:MAG: TolB family protein [Eubacteriales bacterium]
MIRFSRTCLWVVFLPLLVCTVVLIGCGAGPGEKDLAGGTHVTLESTENLPLPLFPGRLAVIRQGDLWVLEGGKVPLRLTSDGCNSSPAWSPDGKRLLFYKYDPSEKWERRNSLWVARADGGGVYNIEPEKQVLDARWSPAANRIAYLTARQDERFRSEDFKLAEISDKGPGEPLLLEGVSEKIVNFCWFPTGEKLVFTTADDNPYAKENLAIKVLPSGGGEAKTLLTLEPGFLPDAGHPPFLSSYLGGLKFSPNTFDLSFFRYPRSASLTADGVSLYVTSIEGKAPQHVATMLAYPGWVDWYYYGDLLAFIEGGGREALFNKRLSILPVHRPDLAVTVTPEGCVDRDPAWSPEGNFIAVSRAKSSQVISGREEWPPSSIWLVKTDGSGARQISTDGETPECSDYHPWWAGGGKSLLWVRVQGEKASIWQAGADGENKCQVYDGLDIPEHYYGAFKWDAVMAWHPGEFYHPLPFSGEQVREIKSVGDNFILIERGTSSDHNYYLDHPSFKEIKNIVGFIETAKFQEYKDGELIFTARGGSDTGNFQFPYKLIYNPNTEELTREDLFLALNEQEQISFGKQSWKQILTNFKIQDPFFAFDFRPAAGEFLAGGRRLPHTTVQYDKKSNDLVFSFLNVELADTLKEKIIIKSPGLKYVKEVRLEQLLGRPDDDLNPTQLPMVRVRVKLTGKPLYNVNTSYLGGIGYEETNRCTVSFR